MSFSEALKNIEWEDIKDTFFWLCYSIIGGAFPMWFGIITFKFTIYQVVNDGSLFIFSAAILASQLYIVTRDSKGELTFLTKKGKTNHPKIKFPGENGLILLLFVLLFLSFAGYASTFSPDKNPYTYWVFSLIILSLSSIIGVIILLVDNSTDRFIDILHFNENQLTHLDENFSKLER
jgi:hypothetical protein